MPCVQRHKNDMESTYAAPMKYAAYYENASLQN